MPRTSNMSRLLLLLFLLLFISSNSESIAEEMDVPETVKFKNSSADRPLPRNNPSRNSSARGKTGRSVVPKLELSLSGSTSTPPSVDAGGVFQLSPRIVTTERATYRGFVRAVKMKRSKGFAIVETFRGIQFASLPTEEIRVPPFDKIDKSKRSDRRKSGFIDADYNNHNSDNDDGDTRSKRSTEWLHGGSPFYSSSRFMPPSALPMRRQAITTAVEFAAVCPQRFPSDEESSGFDVLRRRKLRRMKEETQGYKHRSDAEDCLYLNLYVPFEESNEASHLFPVLLFVHGESFDFGTGNAYDGTILASRGRIIVVTINYRLGPLGFLSTVDSQAAGNYALQDIEAALHWLKVNIKNFHGDPTRVTAVGHGYGAALVDAILSSRSSLERRPFKRAILMSGSFHSEWSASRHPLLATGELADRLNCSPAHFRGISQSRARPRDNETSFDFGSEFKANQIRRRHLEGSKNDSDRALLSKRYLPLASAIIVDCLKRTPVDRLLSAATKRRFKSTFGPTKLDTRRMTTKNSKADPTTTNEATSDVEHATMMEIMVGINEDDGRHFFGRLDLDHGNPGYLLRNYVEEMFTRHKQAMYNVLMHQYTNVPIAERAASAGPADDRLKTLTTEFLTDALYAAPMFSALRKFSESGGSDKKLFAYVGQGRSFSGYDDLSMMFGDPLAVECCTPLQFYGTGDREQPPRDQMSSAIIDFWSNFIYHGDPNIRRQQNQESTEINGGLAEWPQYSIEDGRFLKIGGNSMSVEKNYRPEKISLWLDLVPRLHGSDGHDDGPNVQLNSLTNSRKFEELSDSSNTESSTFDRSYQQINKKAEEPTKGSGNNSNLIARNFFSISVPLSSAKFPDQKTSPAGKSVRLNTASPLSSSQIKSHRKIVGSPSNDTDPEGPAHEALPFRITLVVGLSLLCLNVVAFSVVCLVKRHQGHPKCKRECKRECKSECRARNPRVAEKNEGRRPSDENHFSIASGEEALAAPSSPPKVLLVDSVDGSSGDLVIVTDVDHRKTGTSSSSSSSSRVRLHRFASTRPPGETKRGSREKGVHFFDEIDHISTPCPTSQNFDRADKSNGDHPSTLDRNSLVGFRHKNTFSQSTV